MKLLRYRVRDFRSVEDSNWIDVENTTALVGVNESGKTNLLLPLWKLRPAKEGELEPTSDYPKAKFGDIRKAPKSFKFIEAEFVNEEGDSSGGHGSVTASKVYSGDWYLDAKKWIYDESHETLEKSEDIDLEAKEAELKIKFDKLCKQIPQFLYYSNFGNLDSEIYLPHVVQNLSRSDLGAKEAAKARTLRVLFKFVGLDAGEILELGLDFKDNGNPHRQPSDAEIQVIAKKKKERSILLQAAGTKLTTEFKNWWKQGDYRFRFQADGEHFRIWVSDERRPEEVELEARSTGLQWFLSFFLVFLVESEGEHKNTILLLDEPGLSLHPLAQRDLSAFFENLSKTNQLIYTTHSPFLIEAGNLHKARKVYVDEFGKTKATANLKEGDTKSSQKGATYALNSALNLQVSETLLIGCEPIIVEGPSDQYILSGIKNLLIGAGKITPKKELVFPPSGGAKSVKVISSILLGRDNELPSVLLDDDTIGRSASKELKTDLYKDKEHKILNVATFTKMLGSEIEDIIPSEIYVKLTDNKFRADNLFADVFVAGNPIIPQIENWAAQEEIVLEKGWKVSIAIGFKTTLSKMEITKVDENTIAMWVSLFKGFENQ